MRSLTLLCLLTSSLVVAAPKVAAPGLRAIGLDAMFVEFLNEQLAAGFRSSGIEVVTTNEIKSLIGLERQKQLLGCKETDASCMAEISGALGVEALAMGDVVQLDKSFQVSLKVVSAADGRVLAFETTRVPSREGMADAAVNAGKRMGLKLRGMVVAPPPAAVDEAAATTPSAEEKPTECPKGQWCKVSVYSRWVGGKKSAYDLMGIKGSGADNIWAVGYGATVLHWDGKAWQERNAPSSSGGVLRAVWSPNPNLAYVAGQNGAAFKWKGQGWISIAEPNYASFYAINGTPDGKVVWAATDKGVLELDSGEWKPMWAEQTVWDVFTISADQAYAVAKEKLLRYSGGKWSAIAGAPTDKMSAVFATGPNDVWFGGEGLILRYDPSKKGEAAWKRYKLGGRASVLTMWGTAADDLWAAATYGSLLHFDGEDWVSVPAPSGGTVFGVTGAGKDDIWFVQELPNVRPGSGAYHYRRSP